MEEFIIKDLYHYCNVSLPACTPLREQEIDFYDFTFVVSGTMTYFSGDRRYVMKKNDAILFPPGTVRRRLAGDSHVRYVSFNFTLVDGAQLPLSEFLPGIVTGSIKSLVNIFPQSHLYDNYHSKAKLVSILNYLLYELLDVADSKTANGHVTRIMRYIEENMGAKISLSEVGRAVGLTKEYTASLFKREVGKTVTEYINERKLLYAKEVILSGEIGLEKIAHNLGYENYTYFSRIFKKYYGYSPKQLLTR